MGKIPLDYRSPLADQNQAKRHSRLSDVVIGIAAGAMLTPPVILLAILSGGHGDRGLARAIFPIPMLMMLLTQGTIGAPSIACALLQLPLYGAVAGWCDQMARVGVWRGLAVLAIVHAIAVALCFSRMILNFS